MSASPAKSAPRRIPLRLVFTLLPASAAVAVRLMAGDAAPLSLVLLAGIGALLGLTLAYGLEAFHHLHGVTPPPDPAESKQDPTDAPPDPTAVARTLGALGDELAAGRIPPATARQRSAKLRRALEEALDRAATPANREEVPR